MTGVQTCALPIYFGDGLAEAGDADWLARLADFFEDAEALGFELGDGYFFHISIYTMVYDHGQMSELQLRPAQVRRAKARSCRTRT